MMRRCFMIMDTFIKDLLALSIVLALSLRALHAAGYRFLNDVIRDDMFRP